MNIDNKEGVTVLVNETTNTDTFTRVAEWNRRVGKNPHKVGTQGYWVALKQAADLIAEELAEVYEGIQNRDLANVVKEGSDLDVVVAGLNYQIASNYPLAIDAVLSNNDLKYTEDRAEAEAALEYHKKLGNLVRLELVISDEEDKIFFSVRRNSDDKIMKFPNHPKTSLEDAVPEMAEELTLIVAGSDYSIDNLNLINKITAIDPEISVVGYDDIDDNQGIIKELIQGHGHVVVKVVNCEMIQAFHFSDEEKDS